MNNDQGENHESGGAALFEYCHRNGGNLSRIGFQLRAGDNPDFFRARLLMPGAEFLGICYGAFDVDTSAVPLTCEDRPFYALLTAGHTTFRIELWARDQADFERRCREIGALQFTMLAPSRWERAKCILRFFWLRRPTIRLRSPLDVLS